MTDRGTIAILAAGRARRFGGGKLDAPCAGKPLGRWTLDAVAAAGALPGFIVVGQETPAFAHAAEREGWTLIVNPRADEGMGSSVALAASHAARLKAETLLLLLADMPLIPPSAIRALLDHVPATAPAATRYPSGRPGAPARFPATLFGAMAVLHGDRGAASLLEGRTDLHLMEPAENVLIDVDDAAGLARAEALLSAGSYRV